MLCNCNQQRPVGSQPRYGHHTVSRRGQGRSHAVRARHATGRWAVAGKKRLDWLLRPLCGNQESYIIPIVTSLLGSYLAGLTVFCCQAAAAPPPPTCYCFYYFTVLLISPTPFSDTFSRIFPSCLSIIFIIHLLDSPRIDFPHRRSSLHPPF